MTGYTHAVGGAAAGLALAGLAHAPLLPMVAGSVAGALAVDLDHPASLATSAVPGAGMIHAAAGDGIQHRGAWHSVLPGLLVAPLMGAVAAALPYAWPLLLVAGLAVAIIAWHVHHTRHALACWSEDTHPGTMHGLAAYALRRSWPLILPLALGAAAPAWFAPAALAGWLSHLALDGLTPHGVAPLWPLPWRAHGPVATGGPLEWLVAGGLVVLVAVLLPLTKGGALW